MTCGILELETQSACPLERTFLAGIDGVTEILLIRHGEAVSAFLDDEEGWEPALTPLGEHQAHRLDQRLHEEGGVPASTPARCVKRA